MKRDTIHYFLIICIAFVLSAPWENSHAVEQDPQLSFVLKDTPLSNVVEDISKRIHYQITLDKKCGNPNISGAYEMLPLEKLFPRLLKNTIVLIDYDNRVIHLDCIDPNENPQLYQGAGDTAQNTVDRQPDIEYSQTTLSVEDQNILEVSTFDPMPVPEPTSGKPGEFEEMIDSATGLTFSEMEKELKIKIN